MVHLRFVFICVAALFTCGLFGGEAPRQFKAKRVIILVIDGARYTETWGEPNRKYIPHTWPPNSRRKACSSRIS